MALENGGEKMKAGVQTTEFWMTILTNIVSIVGALQGVISPEIAAIIVSIANGIYGVLRTIAKKTDKPVTP